MRRRLRPSFGSARAQKVAVFSRARARERHGRAQLFRWLGRPHRLGVGLALFSVPWAVALGCVLRGLLGGHVVTQACVPGMVRVGCEPGDAWIFHTNRQSG